MCVDVGLTSRAAVTSLIDEAQQLTKIFIAAQLTATRRKPVRPAPSAILLLQCA
jgi:hypothetical protein